MPELSKAIETQCDQHAKVHLQVFFSLKLKITKIAGSKGFYYSGQRYNYLDVNLVYFPDLPRPPLESWDEATINQFSSYCNSKLEQKT